MVERRRGFTLVELLVVIGILSILMYLLAPTLAKAREKVRQTTCLSNQRQIGLAITMEVKDANERYPTAEEVWTVVKLGPDILLCPTSSATSGQNSYGFNGALAGQPMNIVASPTTTLITGDAKMNLPGNLITDPADYDHRHNGRFIASFVDGHVKLIDDPASGE